MSNHELEMQIATYTDNDVAPDTFAPFLGEEFDSFSIRIDPWEDETSKRFLYFLDLEGNPIDRIRFIESGSSCRATLLSQNGIALTGALSSVSHSSVREIVFESDFEIHPDPNGVDFIVWDYEYRKNRNVLDIDRETSRNFFPREFRFDREQTQLYEETLDSLRLFANRYELPIERIQLLLRIGRKNFVLSESFSGDESAPKRKRAEIFPLSAHLLEIFLGLRRGTADHFLLTKNGESLLAGSHRDNQKPSLFLSNRICMIANGAASYARFSRLFMDGPEAIGSEIISVKKIYNAFGLQEVFHTIRKIKNEIPVANIPFFESFETGPISERIRSSLLSKGKFENPYILLLKLWSSKEEWDTKKIVNLVGAVIYRASSSKNLVFSELAKDTFVFVFDFENDRNQIDRIKDRIGKTLSKKHRIGRDEVSFLVSMGIASIESEKKSDLETSIRLALEILERKPIRGKFTFDANDDLRRKKSFADFLSNPPKTESDQKLFFQYQPIIDVRTGEIPLLESLARLESEGRIFFPNDFLGKNPDLDSLLELGRRSFLDALRLISELQSNGNLRTKVAINISPEQLSRLEFSESLLNIAKEFSEDWKRIVSRVVIEITENSEMIDGEICRYTIQVLQNIGISFSLDDFGTGYSSFNLLKSVPVEFVKIDKAFIKGVTENSLDRLIVNSILEIASLMELKVIAEGVENEKQFLYLLSIGVELIQGFHVFKPLSRDSLPEILFPERIR
ncbi:EAL domain-containing protein [Leptospira gomenensis]|nr:EAL domain-containing protein [Leptospira gomenensis]TGK44425.1 EAL domain-containing protein [Leptospira gomenensis]